MLNKLIVSFLLLTSPLLNAKCLDGKIKYIYKKKEVIQKEKYCISSFMISDKCHNKKCDKISQFPKPIHIEGFLSSVGSPGFKLCHHLNGSPQIIKYWEGRKWIHSSRCIFNKDEYVEIGYLMKRWKPFITYAQ